MNDENPYRPPVSLEDPAAHDPAFWYTAGRALYVRDGAELPQVELETGQTQDLTPEIQQFREERWTTWNLISIGLGSFILARVTGVETWDFFPLPLILPVIAILALRLAFFRFAAKDRRTFSFTLHRSAFTIANRSKATKARTFYKVALALTGFAPWLATYPNTHTAAIILVFIGLITWRVARQMRKRDPLLFRLPESYDAEGWVRIGNIHPRALKKLTAIENRDEVSEEIPSTDAPTASNPATEDS